MAEAEAPGWDELTRLGLYDPASPNAEDRRALLEHYLERGVTTEVMVAAHEAGTLVTVLGDRQIRPDRDKFTMAEAAAALGLDLDGVAAALRAAGLPAVPPDQTYWGDADIDLMAGFALASDLFGEKALLHFVRTMGMAASHLATGAIHVASNTYSGPLQAAGASEVERSAANETAVVALDAIPQAFETIFRHHFEHELRRSLLSANEPGSPTATLTVGFVDLVGFTTTSSTLEVDELAGAVAGFEALAGNIVTAHGGRVVKVIGDEVMFVTHEPGQACRIAEDLATAVEHHPGLTTVRAGMTHGQVLTLDGDYYGNGVNLAARAVAVAEPGQVLVDEGLVAALPDRIFASVGERELKGFPDLVELFALTG